MEKRTQAQEVLEHLQTHNGITSMEAFSLYGITRLSAKIFELRKKGYTIFNVDRECVDRRGNKTHFVEYRLVRKVAD